MSSFSKKIKLTNGLTVIYERFDAANVVSVNLGVKIGAVHEEDHESGMCHLIEHMVFKGTKSYQAGAIATLVESHGGELNAYTSWDQTVYYINLPSNHFRLGLNIIKEMAFDAIIDPVELSREKEVILEEIRRSKDNPHHVLGEMLFANFYQKHNYRRPIIGTQKLVQSYEQEQVYQFYKKYYSPQNMVLSICGNINETELSNGIEETFRYAIKKPLSSHNIIPEPKKNKYKIVSKKMDISATYLEIAFPAPQLTHQDVPAIDILSHLLGEAETSLLEQYTKEKEQLVHSIYSTCYTPKHPGTFIISCLLDPKKINAVLQSVKTQIENVKKIPFEEDKIERAKLLSRAQLVYERQTCEGTAKKWITYETMANDYLFDEKYIENVSQLSAADIQKVAKKYLDFSLATVAIVHPNKTNLKIDRTIFSKKQNKTQQKRKNVKKTKDAYLYKLDNGIRVIIKENHRLPFVSVKTASLGGLRYENSSNNGINHLLSNIITRCTQNNTQEQLAEKCEWLGGHLNGYTGRNSFGLSFSFLSDKLHQAIPVFSDVILYPNFDQAEIAKEKALMLEAIKNRFDNPAQTAFRSLLKTLFKGHPYQLHVLGEQNSLKKLTANKLKNYFHKIMLPKNFVIAIVGDFQTHEILDKLNQCLSPMKKSVFKPLKLKKPSISKGIKPIFNKQQREQSHIAMGFLANSIYDKDKFAMELLSNLLSGQGGRLFLELRDKQSLAYTVSTMLIEGLETGFFSTYIATEPNKTQTAINGMLKELNSLKETPVKTQELERTKNYIIGNQEIQNQKNGAIAMQLALNEIYGLGFDEFFQYANRIKKVSVKDIQNVAQKYIQTDKAVMAIAGPKR